MKPTLVNKPNDYEYQQLLVKFAGGVPLSADQLNFLYRHEKTLSHYPMDAIMKYYLRPFYRKAQEHHSFLLHHEHINAEESKALKKRLLMMLQDNKKTRIQFSMTPQQFLELKNHAVPALIFHHGNQFLTGAPFYLGGIPHVVFFQWGNYFGVAKYQVLPDEKALKSNVLIFFEDMQERELLQCVDDFKREMKHELQPQQQDVQTHHLENQLPQENYRSSPYKTPTLNLSRNTTDRDKQK